MKQFKLDPVVTTIIALAATALFLLLSPYAIGAEEAKPEIPSYLTPMPGGAYIISKTSDGFPVAMVVHTYEGLLMDKAAQYDSKDKRTHRNALPEYQELAERLLKIDGVKSVVMSYRQVEIYRFPLAESFEGMMPDIEKAFKAIFEKPEEFPKDEGETEKTD